MPTSTNVTNLKINELTEAQYDAAVQQGIIGENDISILTDYEYAQMIKPNVMPVLVVANWVLNQQSNKYEQTVNCTGVTADNVVYVAPSPINEAEYAECGCLCVGQASGTLTFRCDVVPTNALTVNVIIMQ